jgi:hypothetical protein
MSFELWTACAGLALFAIPIARLTIYKPRYWRIEDLETFGRRVNVEDFERATDPATEWLLRDCVPKEEFRKLKRQNIRLCAEHLSRIAHNAEIIQDWSYSAHSSRSATSTFSDEHLYQLFQLSEITTELRIDVFLARMRVRLWLALRADLLPFWLMPQLDSLRKPAGADILASYQRVADLTKAVAQFYGTECSQRIAGVL